MENISITENNNTGCLTGQASPVKNPAYSSETNPLKVVYILLGVFFLAIGAIGTILPMIPTTPLVLLAAVCFGKSSQKLHKWFLSTGLYKRTIEGFIRNRTMTIKAKIILLISITAVMSLSFATMVIFHVPLLVRILLLIIWLFHMLYFGVKVKTLH